MRKHFYHKDQLCKCPNLYSVMSHACFVLLLLLLDLFSRRKKVQNITKILNLNLDINSFYAGNEKQTIMF